MIVKDHDLWGQKLLECPASGEPLALAKLGINSIMIQIFYGRNVRKICVAYLCVMIPPKHGVNGF
jgi:hypothetical protein